MGRWISLRRYSPNTLFRALVWSTTTAAAVVLLYTYYLLRMYDERRAFFEQPA